MNLRKISKLSQQFKTVLTVTDSDLDGTASKILFHYFLEPNNKLLAFQSGVGIDTVLLLNNLNLDEFDIIGFADLIPTPEYYETLLLNKLPNQEIHIWDHHLTSYNAIVNYPNPHYHFDLNRCSAKLVYDYFEKTKSFNSCVKEFVDLVNTWDLWNPDADNWKMAKALNNMLYRYLSKYRDKGYDYFINFQLKKFNTFEHYNFLDFEKTLIREEQIREDELFAKILKHYEVRKDSQNRSFGYFETSSKISILSHRLLSERPELDYTLCFASYHPEERKFSLRSAGKVKVNKIAECFQGGGHESAAGFHFSDEEQCRQLRLNKTKI